MDLDNVWAVGYYDTENGHRTLIEHWDGTSWSIVPSPNEGAHSNALEGVAFYEVNGPIKLWAVGWYPYFGGRDHTLIERWDCTSWSIMPSPNQGTNSNQLLAVTDNGFTAVAVGWYADDEGVQRPLIEYWHNLLDFWEIMLGPDIGSGGGVLRGS